MRCFYFFLTSFMIFFSIPSWGMNEGSVFPQKGAKKRSFNPSEENNFPRRAFGDISNLQNLQYNQNTKTRYLPFVASPLRTEWQEQAPGNPSPPKRFRRSAPQCDVHPIPGIRIPKEPGKWCRTLDYNYEGKSFSTKDWHWEAGCELRQVKEGTNTGNTNFAKCRIEAIFLKERKGKIKLERKSYEFPKVFSSSNLGEEFISFPQLFTSKGINKRTRFIEKLLGSHIDEKDFAKKYHHTENAILRYVLTNSAEWIKAITPKENPDKKYTLAHFVLTICSYYDSCGNCVRTMYGAGLDKQLHPGKRNYLGKLNKKLQNSELLKEDNLGIFINVSSLSEYKGSRSYRAYKAPNDFNDIKIPGFPPFVAQMRLDLPPPAPTALPFIADTPQMTNFSLIDELEKETSERMTEDQGALARSTLFPQWLGNPPDAEEKGEDEEPELIEFVMAPKAIIPTFPDEIEEEIAEQMMENQDAPARPNLFLQLFGNPLDGKEKGGDEKPKLGQLAKTSSKVDIESKEKETLDGPSNILPHLIGLLIPYLQDKESYKTIKPLLEEAFHKKTTNKVDRDKILSILSSKGTCTSSGSKMPPVVQDTAFLLKTFGWLYLKDNIDVGRVPEHLKIKKRSSKSPQKKSSDTSILSELKKIEADNQENDLGIIARFFRDEIEKHGRFELRDKTKYYYIRIQRAH